MAPSASRSGHRSRRRTRLSTDEIRGALYDAALTRFRAEGYEGTSVSSLTRDTGVAKGTFFNHFPTKEHVLGMWVRVQWDEAVEASHIAGLRGTDAVVHVATGLSGRMEADPSLARSSLDRWAVLPWPAQAWPEHGQPEHAHDPAPTTAPEKPDTLHLKVRRWFEDRLAESLAMSVPLEVMKPVDLAAVLAATLPDSLRDDLETGSEDDGPSVTSALRLATLLRMAGYVAPNPPTGSPA